jgi:dihydroorotase
MKTVVHNARLVGCVLDVDSKARSLGMSDGKIAFIGDEPEGFNAERYIDAKDLTVMPGCVDLAAWLREPGLDYKATLASETYAAIASGITTLTYQPEPAAMVGNSAQFNLIQDINRNLGYAHIRVLGNLTQDLQGERLSNMGGLKRAGCVGVTNGWQPLQSLRVQRLAMEYASTHNITVFIYPLEVALAAGGMVHEGAVASRLGFAAIPSAAETVAVAQTLALIEMTGTRVHFCRLSAEGSVRLIRQAKAQGLPVTADVAAHQLFLTEMDVADFNPLCHVRPPLRSERDREALIEGLADNTIDAICSDHQPHEIDAKLAPFQQTEPGISALETLLPLTLRLVEQGYLLLEQAIAKVTSAPAAIIHDAAGRLQVGAPADIVMLDPEALWTLEYESMLSQGKNTPFAGWSFNGKVRQAWLTGRHIYRTE